MKIKLLKSQLQAKTIQQDGKMENQEEVKMEKDQDKWNLQKKRIKYLSQKIQKNLTIFKLMSLTQSLFTNSLYEKTSEMFFLFPKLNLSS